MNAEQLLQKIKATLNSVDELQLLKQEAIKSTKQNVKVEVEVGAEETGPMSSERLAEILIVHTVTRPNLRDDEFFVFVGQQFLRDLFDGDGDMSSYVNVTLQCPERWLNILEQRALLMAVQVRCPKLQKLHIVTHSVYILQCSPNGTVFVIDDPSEYPEIPYKKGVRYSPPENPSSGQLSILHL
jgi:hypothetical protein